MASEITVTFSDGGIFNGFANSYTKDGLTTYYFEFDKKYRVQLGSLNSITLQQYQNSNGAWYNINIIAAVQVTEIETKVDLSNYYTKSETDNKYVKKTGDTMTGTLYFNTDNSRSYVNGSTLNFYNGNDTNSILLQLHNGTIFMSGRIYLADSITAGQLGNYFQLSFNGLNRSNGYTQPFNVNCPIAFNDRLDIFSYIYVRDDDTSVSFVWQNNGNLVCYAQHGFYMANYAYNGSGAHVMIQGTSFYGDTLTFNNIISANSNIVANANITCYSNISVNPSSGSGANTSISAGTISIFSNLNNNNAQRAIINSTGYYHYMDYSSTYMWLRYNYQRYVTSGATTMEVSSGGIDIYNGRYITYHSGAAGVTEQYTRMNNAGLTMYNASNGNAFTINTGTARFDLTGAYTITMNASNLIAATAGTTLTLTDSGGSIVVKNVIQALNNAFYGEEFLNAVNKVFLFIFNKIGGAVYYEFPSQNYGGGFQAGGGSSRGGGVGRRS